MTNLLFLMFPAIWLVTGLIMLAAPERFRRGHVRNKDREIADRLARGKDAYFEELRTLQAYQKPSSVLTVRFFGGVLTLFCGATLVFRIIEMNR